MKELSVADFQGGKANVAAKVTDLKGDPKFDSKFDVTAKDAGRVLQMAGMGPQPKGKFGALTLKGTAAGTPIDVTYDVNAAMAGIGFQARGQGHRQRHRPGHPEDQLDLRHQGQGPGPDRRADRRAGRRGEEHGRGQLRRPGAERRRRPDL